MAVANYCDDADPSPSGPVPNEQADGSAVPVAPCLHWIDWLRIAAIAGVFVFHTLRPFDATDRHVKNANDPLGARDRSTAPARSTDVCLGAAGRPSPQMSREVCHAGPD